jgi:hypothetical protein
MKAQRLIRWTIQCLRLAALPFPSSFALGAIALNVLFHGRRIGDTNAEPGEEIGRVLLILFAGALQVVLGLPSLLALDVRRSGVRGYFLVGVFSGLALSFLLAFALHAPQFGETAASLSLYVFLFLGIPIICSYLLAFFIRRCYERRWPSTTLQANVAAPGS